MSSSPAVKKLKFWLGSRLLYLIVKAFAATYRYRVFGQPYRDLAEAHHPAKSFCLALWHEHLFASIIAHRKQEFSPLASLSKDGDLVAYVMDRFGFQTVRGSSSRRGEEARDDLVAITDSGRFTAITMDGPRGPRRRVKGGIIDVARRAQVAILPVTTLADRQWVLSRSWDQFKIPKPFARVAIGYGEPLFVAADTQGLAFGNAKAKLKSIMTATEARTALDLSAWSGQT